MSEESSTTRPLRHATAIVCDDVFTEHDAGFGHPESPRRYTAVTEALRAADFAPQLAWLRPAAAGERDIGRCHTTAYIEAARREILSGQPDLSTGDTAVCPDSWKAALHAAGGAGASGPAHAPGRSRSSWPGRPGPPRVGARAGGR